MMVSTRLHSLLQPLKILYRLAACSYPLWKCAYTILLGIFWISYQDLLQKYQHFDRTRIFNDNWHVTQKWTSLQVPWTVDYHSTKFRLTLKEKSPVVIVLAQLDSDYFKGLEGSYNFDLQFRIESEDDDDNDYIVRSHQNYVMIRSVSTDIELDAGTYSIFMKITATPNNNESLEELLPEFAKDRREKLARVGMSYDLAHAKGIFVESEHEKEQRVAREKAKKAKEREKEKQRLRASALKIWEKDKKFHDRQKKTREKRDKAESRRRAQGRFVAREDFADDNNGSMNAARGGSLDEVPLESTKDRGQNDPKDKKPNVPFRLRSFNGEPITTGSQGPVSASAPEESIQAAQDLEQDSVAAAVSDIIDQVGRQDSEKVEGAAKEDPASKVVQPLDAMIAEADAHTSTIQSEKATNTEAQPPTPTIQVNGVDAVTDVKPLPMQPGVSSPDAMDDIPLLAGGNNDVPLAPEAANGEADKPDKVDENVNGTVNAKEVTGGKRGISSEDGDDNDNDNTSIDTFPSFEWHTDLEMSSSDGEDDLPAPLRSKIIQQGGLSSQPLAQDGGINREEIDMGDLEPWNAVCVVGLRVYSLLEGDGVVLEVVRPSLVDEDGDGDGEGGQGQVANMSNSKVGLDRDDPSKSLVEVEGAAASVEVDVGGN